MDLPGPVWDQHGLKLEFKGLGPDQCFSNLVPLAIVGVWAVALAGPVLEQHDPKLNFKVRVGLGLGFRVSGLGLGFRV